MNAKIADHCGKATSFQMRRFQNQKGHEQINKVEKLNETMQSERIRAAKIAALSTHPVDFVKKYEYRSHRSPMKKGVNKIHLTPKSLKQDEENKENGPRINTTNVKSEKNRRKRRVSVGYKNKLSNGAKSKARTSPECEQLPPVVVSRNETSSHDARKLANDLNTTTNDRFKDTMSNVQAEKNKNEVMQTLEKLEQLEKLKKAKFLSEENEWKSTYNREEQQPRMEILVEDVMRVDIVDKSPINQRPEVGEVYSDLFLLNAVKKPEITKIATPTVWVHKSPEKSTVFAHNSSEVVGLPADWSPGSFRCPPPLVTSPFYMHNSPKLRQNDISGATTLPLDLVVPPGRIRWQPRNLTLPTRRLKDPKLIIELPKAPTPRRSSVHKTVVIRELLKNFFEVRGVQSSARKAFTKSYVKDADTPKTFGSSPDSEPMTIRRGFFPPLSDDARDDKDDLDDAKFGDDQLETSVTSNQPNDSLKKEVRKCKAKEEKISECSKDVERIMERQSQLQAELENVRRTRQELEDQPKKTEEELEKMYEMTENEGQDDEVEPEDDDFEDDWRDPEAHVTLRRNRCPVTINRGMNEAPHELSTITEYDTPRSSCVYRMRVTSSPLFSSILETMFISSLDSEAFLQDPSPVRGQLKTDEMSPLTEMLQRCKHKNSVSSKQGADGLSPSNVSLTDSLMSFQRHELSAYSNVEANLSPSASPIFCRPQSFDFNSDSEVQQILEKWETWQKVT